jgi:hypothetical protein
MQCATEPDQAAASKSVPTTALAAKGTPSALQETRNRGNQLKKPRSSMRTYLDNYDVMSELSNSYNNI